MKTTSPKHAIKSRWINRLEKEGCNECQSLLAQFEYTVSLCIWHIYIQRNITSLKSEHLVWLERLCSQMKMNLNEYLMQCGSVWYVQTVLWWCSHRLTLTLSHRLFRSHIRSVDNSTMRSSMLVSMETTMRRWCTLNVFKNILEFSTVSSFRWGRRLPFHWCGREIIFVNISRSHFTHK